MVADQSRSSGDETCLQAAEQQFLPSKVLEFGGRGSQLFTGQITNGTESNRQSYQRVPEDGIPTCEALEDLR